MRQIRQAMDALLRAAHLRREKNDDTEALATVDDLIDSLLSLSAEVVERLDVTSVLQLLSPAGELDPLRTGGLALLLEEKALILDGLLDPERAERTRAKAASLLAAATAAGFDREALLAEARRGERETLA